MLKQKRKTRRQRWKDRPVLSLGDTGVEGEVTRRFDKSGFIRPKNGAADILFHLNNVPDHRIKCVGSGRTVYFEVIEGKKDRRGNTLLQAKIL